MKAVIFDMDGVISDTNYLHSSVESAILAGYGIELQPKEIVKRFAGVSDNEMFSEVFSEAGKGKPDMSSIASRKWERMLNPQPGEIVAIPGTVEFILTLQQQSIPMAVASASSMAFINLVLSTLKLTNVFHTLVSADEVVHGKPAPDVFLLAAERLGALPETCVVIEDGVSGMIAAQAAGMQCVGLLTHLTAEECPTNLVISNLRDLPLERIGL